MTKAAALQYATQGIRINSIHPGFVETPLLEDMPAAQRAGLVALHPMGRLATPHEVAQLVLFLLSDRSSFVTGSQYVIDGGLIAQ
jgi:NAD(P)-dependent dehydrogenase (short-subunit alcohol dehydrogenase family)